MENYEINILKRNGDWKTYNPKDLSSLSGTIENIKELDNKDKNDQKKDINIFSFINEVSLIVNKLENLENEKKKLKDELKKYDNIFQSHKKLSEQKITQISKEIEMFDKTIAVIKNLKDF